ncbi:MAG TPA: pyridoxal-phosphate dependent enzyme [Chloroflexota bacterium]|nr:pyridoxal-phosphate dependent enzyme [Chloroflexota bacterium]
MIMQLATTRPTIQSVRVTLGEGNTPLVRSRWIGPHLGLDDLYFKLEQTNPTGSYKDRFAAELVSRLALQGHRVCLGTSSGNTGAALAAYAAAAGVACVLCVPADAPEAKLTQIRAYGARIVRVTGMVASPQALRQTLSRLSAIARQRGLPLGISAYALAPEGMAGVEPLSAEIVAALGVAPDHVYCPVGGGGLLTATWRGFLAISASSGSPIDERAALPRLHAVQSDANDTVVSALDAGERRAREVSTVTRISGLGVPVDLDATASLEATRESGGRGYLVDDELVWQIQSLLARHEGLYVEPAGAVSVAGLWHAARQGHVRSGETAVCLLTGHGFKDEAAAQRLAQIKGPDLILEPSDLDETLLDGVEPKTLEVAPTSPLR